MCFIIGTCSSNSLTMTTDLEIYTIWNDGWQLLTLALMLLIFTNAIPLPASLTGSSSSSPGPKKPYARLAIIVTIFHHITTCYGAYQHYSLPSHYTKAMGIGVWFNVFLTAAGLVALFFGVEDGKVVSKGRGKKRA